MDIKEALSKIKEVDGGSDLAEAITKAIGDNEKAVELAQKAVKDAEGKAAAILADKKKAQEKLGEIEKRMEEIESAGLSDAEKIKKEADKAEARAAKAEQALQEVESNFQKERRANAIGQIGSKVKFLDSVPADTQRLMIESALREVDDLNDSDSVSAVLTQFQETHKGLLAADGVATGAGTSHGTNNGGGQTGTKTFTRTQIEAMTPAEFEENSEAIYAAEAAGAIK